LNLLNAYTTTDLSPLQYLRKRLCCLADLESRPKS